MSNVPDIISSLLEAVIREHPLHRKFVETALAELTTEELREFQAYLEFLTNKGKSIDYLADCYLTIVEDTLNEQIYFGENGKYRYSTLDEVANIVYHNDDYMSRYMYGLALTDFLWPNHVAMVRFFKRTLPRDDSGAYLEIGPGHGQYMMTAMEHGGYSSFLGVDLSETSIAQTKAIVQHFKPEHANQARFELKDFLAVCDLRPASFDAIVMGEVLEHVENPQDFLLRIAELAKPGAYIYVTTCINAPAIDHIYLWRTLESLETMINDHGLTIQEKLYLPYLGKSLDEAIDEALPINTAFVLEKA